MVCSRFGTSCTRNVSTLSFFKLLFVLKYVNKAVRTFAQSRNFPLKCIDWSATEELCAAAGNDGVVALWDIRAKKQVTRPIASQRCYSYL